jgi:hypothetical protein
MCVSEENGADNLDAANVVGLLIRYREGDTRVWSTASVPGPLDEDQRHVSQRSDTHCGPSKRVLFGPADRTARDGRDDRSVTLWNRN